MNLGYIFMKIGLRENPYGKFANQRNQGRVVCPDKKSGCFAKPVSESTGSFLDKRAS
jgi:hypothetical protein